MNPEHDSNRSTLNIQHCELDVKGYGLIPLVVCKVDKRTLYIHVITAYSVNLEWLDFVKMWARLKELCKKTTFKKLNKSGLELIIAIIF